MRNRFTALALIFIAIISIAGESPEENEEQTAEVMDVNTSVIFETDDDPEASEPDVKSDTAADELTIGIIPEEPVTETSITEPEEESPEDTAI